MQYAPGMGVRVGVKVAVGVPVLVGVAVAPKEEEEPTNDMTLETGMV